MKKTPSFLLVAAILLTVIFGGGGAFAQNVSITTFDQQTLTGVIRLPDGAVTGAVLILQGSGNVGADGDVSGPMLGSGYQGQPAKLSEQMAAQFASVGIASLRYAKRGVEDAKQLPNQTMPFLVKDAESALKVLEAQFPKVKIGVVGLSEGALVASLLADDLPVNALYLLSVPTRAIDDVFGYQFFDWPTELLIQHFDPAHLGSFTEPTEMDASTFNLLGAPTWASIDANQDHQIAETAELFPTYQKYYYSMRGLLQSPAYLAWYQGLKAVPAYSEIAAKIMSASIYIYQAKDDAQVRWNWVEEDSYAFKVAPTIHYFEHVGHCFSPMAGPFGGVKTSGPLSADLLNQLAIDVTAGLQKN